MSLLSAEMEACTMLNKTTVDDGYGGHVDIWVDGARFGAAIDYNNSMQARLAGAQGVRDFYNIVTSRTINLDYHDVFRRDSDGAVFRVTSSGADSKTPKTARLDMRVVSAEKWVLP